MARNRVYKIIMSIEKMVSAGGRSSLVSDAKLLLMPGSRQFDEYVYENQEPDTDCRGQRAVATVETEQVEIFRCRARSRRQAWDLFCESPSGADFAEFIYEGEKRDRVYLPGNVIEFRIAGGQVA